MSFPVYPEYKESGVEWLGEVPAHWDIKRLKHLVQCCDGERIPLNGEQRHEKKGTVPYWGANAVMDYVDEALFNEDLVLLGEDGAPFFDSGREVAFFSQGPVWPNNHIHVLRPLRKYTGRWIVHALNETNYIDFIEGSTRDKLTQLRMMTIPIPIPPPSEVYKLLRFLDYETARIDALIEEQKRLIELLKEKRQAVISHAVTKGLDPSVPMKDSGVEWLGEVPAHWDVLPLKRAVVVRGGGTPSKENVEYWEGSVPWVSPKDMKRKVIARTADNVSDEAVRESNLPIIEHGAVLMVVRGMILSHSIPVAQAGIPLTINQDMKALVGVGGLSSEYLLLLLAGIRDAIFEFIDSSAHGTRKLEWERFENISIPVPPSQEQQIIIEETEKEVRRVEDLSGHAFSAIGLLQERRSALISAAVTGKIDVRDWQLPEHHYSAQAEASEGASA